MVGDDVVGDHGVEGRQEQAGPSGVVHHEVVVHLHGRLGLTQDEATTPVANQGVAPDHQAVGAEPVTRHDALLTVHDEVAFDRIMPPAPVGAVRDAHPKCPDADVVQDPTSQAGLVAPTEQENAFRTPLRRRPLIGREPHNLEPVQPDMPHVVQDYRGRRRLRVQRRAQPHLLARVSTDHNGALEGAGATDQELFDILPSPRVEHIPRAHPCQRMGEGAPRLGLGPWKRVAPVGRNEPSASERRKRVRPPRHHGREQPASGIDRHARKADRQVALRRRDAHHSRRANHELARRGNHTAKDGPVGLKT